MAGFTSLRNAFPAHSGNDTAPVGLTRLPNTILETFIPGYSLLSGFILDVFGFDVSIVVSILLLVFGVITAGHYIYGHLRTLCYTYLTSTVTIYSRDDLFDPILSWISDHNVTKTGRNLRAKSLWASAWDADDYVDIGGMESNGLVNFRSWAARIPPQFEPHSTSAWFWYKGSCFQVSRQKETIDRNMGYYTYSRNEELLTIRVMGRSAGPIKRLIKEARDTTLAKESNKTAILRPDPKQASGHGVHTWKKVARRPTRPIETVVLDADQKEKILLDINEYLHPASRRWYANRGIPYRRGYLFHGPPGTGKTSLSFAIAGVFGLSIFCVSLMEPTLTEGDLAHLFNMLPPRCVVLLEDIDTAGLSRKRAKKNESSGENIESSSEEPEKPKPKPASQRPRNSKPKFPGDTEEPSGISLSGLLNAIDGVASHEGRVLVMTTNHPERLDEALIRPGRVDMQIEFTLATRQQIREIFVRMYSGVEAVMPSALSSKKTAEQDTCPSVRFFRWPLFGKSVDASEKKADTSPFPPLSTITTTSSCPSDSIPTPGTSSSASSTEPADKLSSLSISDLSHLFASHLPERTFSPAEVQGFLLMRKREPVRAVREVEAWREEMIAAREKKKQAEVKGEGKGKVSADVDSEVEEKEDESESRSKE